MWGAWFRIVLSQSLWSKVVTVHTARRYGEGVYSVSVRRESDHPNGTDPCPAHASATGAKKGQQHCLAKTEEDSNEGHLLIYDERVSLYRTDWQKKKQASTPITVTHSHS
jgi:hypothetical protein